MKPLFLDAGRAALSRRVRDRATDRYSVQPVGVRGPPPPRSAIPAQQTMLSRCSAVKEAHVVQCRLLSRETR